MTVYVYYVAGLIDYNFWNFRQGIEDVFALRHKKPLENGDIAINGVRDLPR